MESVHGRYKCKSCGKEFLRTETLKNHIYTIHEGNKDHKCCGRSFSDAGSLKKHTLRCQIICPTQLAIIRFFFHWKTVSGTPQLGKFFLS